MCSIDFFFFFFTVSLWSSPPSGEVSAGCGSFRVGAVVHHGYRQGASPSTTPDPFTCCHCCHSPTAGSSLCHADIPKGPWTLPSLSGGGGRSTPSLPPQVPSHSGPATTLPAAARRWGCPGCTDRSRCTSSLTHHDVSTLPATTLTSSPPSTTNKHWRAVHIARVFFKGHNSGKKKKKSTPYTVDCATWNCERVHSSIVQRNWKNKSKETHNFVAQPNWEQGRPPKPNFVTLIENTIHSVVIRMVATLFWLNGTVHSILEM